MVKQESISISISLDVHSISDHLHLRRIWSDPNGTPVLMIHGAVENGRIFYTDSGKGLAPFLAKMGFDVYVADLRGRGNSTPPISARSNHGQNESINQDIPALVNYIRNTRGPVPQSWIGHSWGGVLFLSVYARYPDLRPLVRNMIFFGSKRSVRAKNLEVFLKLNLFWNRIASQITKVVGYLPAKQLKIGSDNETLLSHFESVSWVKSESWVDPIDGFDYGSALRVLKLPHMLFLAGKNDHALGHVHDVRRLMGEVNATENQLWLLGKETGFKYDYNHIDMLTHTLALEDHFPRVAQWIKASST